MGLNKMVSVREITVKGSTMSKHTPGPENQIKVSVCTHRPILTPCGLKDIAYQVDPYLGCEHYCYSCYALAQAETDWAREIRIKG